MKTFAVFASGDGSNFSAIATAVQKGKIHAHLACLICDQPSAYVIERAKQIKVPSYVLSIENYRSKKAFEEEILAYLKGLKVDFIVLAGYMRLVGATLLEAYPDKILNIHPSYLPNFPGRHGIEDAYQAGVKETGVTVHLIDQGIDSGPIIKQVKVPIYRDEPLEILEKRIHQVEHQLYSEVIETFIQGGYYGESVD